MLTPILATDDPYRAAEVFIEAGWSLVFQTSRDSGDPLACVALADVPEPDEIDDYEGFGMFQDVWPITDVSVDEANTVAREDGLLGGNGCGFDFDPVRPELLVINGRSVEDTLRLGRAVLASIEVFRSLG